MALPARPIHVPAGLPIDEVTRPELLDAGQSNVQNRNVRNYELGALEKRLGNEPMTTERLDGTSRESGFRLVSRADNACVIDADANLDQYVSTLDQWSTTGTIPEATYTLRPLPSPTSDANVFDAATTNGMIAVAYGRSSDSAAIMAVFDAANGSVISPLAIIGSGPNFDRGFHAVGAIKGRYFIAITTSLLDTEVRAYKFDTQNIAAGWVSLGTIETDLATAYTSICSLDDRVIVGYGIGTGANRVVVKAVDETGAIDSTTILTSSGTPTIVDVDGRSNDVVWVAYDNGVNMWVTALSPGSLGTVVGAKLAIWTTISTDVQGLRVCAGTAQNAQLWLATRGADPDGSHPAVALALEATIVAGAVVRGHDGAATSSRFGSYFDVIISSRPFYRDGRYYLFIAAGTIDPEEAGANIQGTCILVDWTISHTNLRPVANVEPGLGARLQIWSKVFSLDADATQWLYARQFLKAGSEETLSGSYGASFVEIDFAAADRWRYVEHHGVTPIGGGVVGVWDGADFTELGFLSSPRSPHVYPGTSGPLSGTYRYVATYEDVDAAGNVAVSGVSRPTEAVVLTSDDADLSVRDLAVTYRTRVIGAAGGILQPRVRKVLYRTLSTGEPPYYRLGIVDAGNAFHDDVSDADLALQPKLYAPNLPGAVGESLDRRAPPQLLHLVSYAGMLVGAKGASLFYSGQPVYGEATWFSPVFELPIPGAEEITGLAVQDGALVVFTRKRIFIVAGEIPSDNGAQGGLGASRLVSSEWGCIDAGSIVATQLGVFFQSERGIEIFTRAQSVEWIGESVLDTLAMFSVVTSAVVDARSSLARFTLAAARVSGQVVPYDSEGGTGGGRDLVFDLSTKSWISIDDRAEQEAAQDGAYLNVGGRRYAWLGRDGVVHIERDRGAEQECRDGDAWVTSQYTTPPWKLGLQQDHRIDEMMLLYERSSSSGITIEVAEDYGAFGAITEDKVWLSTFLDAHSNSSQVGFRPRSHGFAVQLRIRDVAPDGSEDSGRGMTWIGISADVAQKQGFTRATPRLADEMRR